MYREYEVCEVMPNGSVRRESLVSGLQIAIAVLHELAKRTPNECFATDARTRQIVAQMNLPARRRAAKRIFQISYNEELGLARAELLRHRGYGVISVAGNEKARLLLSSIQPYDLFILGHECPKPAREEMVGWLRVNYPEVKVLALNLSGEELTGADYNVTLNGPESWMPIVIRELGDHAGSLSAQNRS